MPTPQSHLSREWLREPRSGYFFLERMNVGATSPFATPGVTLSFGVGLSREWLRVTR